MKKMKWQNYLLAALSAYVVIFFSLSFLPHEEQTPSAQIPSAPAEIGGREDKQSRDEYERQMVVDPKTGEIPYNIKKDEQAFAKQRYQGAIAQSAANKRFRDRGYSEFWLGQLLALKIMEAEHALWP